MKFASKLNRSIALQKLFSLPRKEMNRELYHFIKESMNIIKNNTENNIYNVPYLYVLVVIMDFDKKSWSQIKITETSVKIFLSIFFVGCSGNQWEEKNLGKIESWQMILAS